jgi:hypothetical protein
MAIAESSEEVGYGEGAVLVSLPNLSHSNSYIFLFAAPWLLLRAARRWDIGKEAVLVSPPNFSHSNSYIFLFAVPWLLLRAARRWDMRRRRC